MVQKKLVLFCLETKQTKLGKNQIEREEKHASADSNQLRGSAGAARCLADEETRDPNHAAKNSPGISDFCEDLVIDFFFFFFISLPFLNP